MPCAPQTGLQSVLGYSEFLRRFTGGVALHIAQNKRGAQQRRKLIEVLADDFAQLRAHEHLLRIWPAIRESFRGRQLVFARSVVQRYGWASFGTSPPHQRRVNHDARQPGGKLRAPFEALQVAIRRQKSILQSVFCVLCISEHAQSSLKQRTLVAAE